MPVLQMLKSRMKMEDNIMDRNLQLLQFENDKKDQLIEQMTGDIQVMGEVQNLENLQYIDICGIP